MIALYISFFLFAAACECNQRRRTKERNSVNQNKKNTCVLRSRCAALHCFHSNAQSRFSQAHNDQSNEFFCLAVGRCDYINLMLTMDNDRITFHRKKVFHEHANYLSRTKMFS